MPTVAETLAMRISIIVMVADGLQPLGMTCLADAMLVDLVFDLHTMELVSMPFEFRLHLWGFGAEACLISIIVVRPSVAAFTMEERPLTIAGAHVPKAIL
jgi:hypothetical protein